MAETLTPSELRTLRRVRGLSLRGIQAVVGSSLGACHRYEAGSAPVPVDLNQSLKILIPACDEVVEIYLSARAKITGKCVYLAGEVEPETATGPAGEPEHGESESEPEPEPEAETTSGGSRGGSVKNEVGGGVSSPRPKKR